MSKVEPVRNLKSKPVTPSRTSQLSEPAAPPLASRPESNPEMSVKALGREVLEQFDRSWQKTHAETEKRIKVLSPESRKLVELQSAVQNLGLGSQLLTQTAEAVNGTIRRVQQLGSGS